MFLISIGALIITLTFFKDTWIIYETNVLFVLLTMTGCVFGVKNMRLLKLEFALICGHIIVDIINRAYFIKDPITNLFIIWGLWCFTLITKTVLVALLCYNRSADIQTSRM
jgi:hypothetical protein